MNMHGGARAYQVMIDYYEFLKSAYLYDEPKAEPENIPVEVEIVEVEQKTVDEPIVIKVEAPFESTPQQPLSAPKTLKLPRRSGIVRLPIQTKKSAAERMAEAFDGRLDDLVESIQNPPESAQPKQRKQTESLVKIRKSVKPADFKGTKGPGFFQNSSLFVFNKTKDAFGRAAELRKNAAEQGMPEQDKGFYVKKALGLEFGGDATDNSLSEAYYLTNTSDIYTHAISDRGTWHTKFSMGMEAQYENNLNISLSYDRFDGSNSVFMNTISINLRKIF